MSYSDLIGSIGLGVSVLGFGFTVWQLSRTANATVATKNAIISANKRMLLNHLLVLLPQLKSLEADLDSSIVKDDRAGAVRALVEFSHAANQVAALLESQDANEDVGLAAELRKTAKNASASKAVLVSGISKPLGTLLKSVSAEVSAVSSKCAGLSTTYQIKVA